MTRAEDIEEAPAHLTPVAADAYLEARTQGLCHEGALEVALGIERSAAASKAQLEEIESRAGDPTAIEIPPHY